MGGYQTTNLLSSETIRGGQRLACPTVRPVRWGRFEAGFDPAEGWLRTLRVDGQEVVHAIYGAVRDRHWGTVRPRLHDLHMEKGEAAFRVSFEVECVTPAIEFRWQGEVVGEENGTLTFRFAGEALAGFWKNRIGLCVLHPLEVCAGEPCRIETVEGAVLDEVFPQFIAPHQPFKRVRAITHEATPGMRVEVRFAGEVFETEDQRNWTDASFKTYSTPLEQPFPVWIERGTRVEQSVTVRLLAGDASIPRRDCVQRRTGTTALRFVAAPDSIASTSPALSAAGGSARAMPSIGFGMASHGAALTQGEAARLRQLQPAHLRVDLRLCEPAWRTLWRQAAADAGAVGAALHAALILSDDAERELAALNVEWSARPVPVALWLVFHENEASTTARWVRLAAAALPAGSLLAAGTNANFAELNRARPEPAEIALPCYSLNPQVHAFDDASLIENLGAQAATVESVRQFAPRPVVISPITLRPRLNPGASPGSGMLPPEIDGRQMTLFGAAWTVGSLARLAAIEGVHSLTYYETTGWRGVMETVAGSPCPELFPSLPGSVFPMFHVFSALAEGESIIPTRSSHPARLDGFCVMVRGGRCRWVVANLGAAPQVVHVLTGGSRANVRVLDETNAELAMREPETLAFGVDQPTPSGVCELELRAYAIGLIETEV